MNLLQDDTGKTSTMRVMSFIALVASVWFGQLTLTVSTNPEAGIYITSAFLISAFAPKALQKFIESKKS